MRPKQILLALLLLAAGSGAPALGQGVAGYDPEQFPAIQGKVAQYSLTPRGDVDGLILNDGTEVHLPPHLGAQLVFAVKPGDQVTVRGLKARAVPMIDAMSVETLPNAVPAIRNRRFGYVWHGAEQNQRLASVNVDASE